MLRVKSAVRGFWRATRAASRASTLSSLAISLTMMRSLQVADELAERGLLAGEASIGLGEAGLARRVDQQPQHQIGEFVAGGALDRPVRAQRSRAGARIFSTTR